MSAETHFDQLVIWRDELFAQLARNPRYGEYIQSAGIRKDSFLVVLTESLPPEKLQELGVPMEFQGLAIEYKYLGVAYGYGAPDDSANNTLR